MKKTLKEFLENLNTLNQANIDYLNGKNSNIILNTQYEEEYKAIQDLINSFNFDKD